VYEFTQVNETLGYLENWFSSIKDIGGRLPMRVDMEFLISGIERILDAGHFKPIQKVLGILYHHCELFQGAHRNFLFNEFLLGSQFYTLFLNWHPTTRNFFQQILIFKMLPVQRSVLKANGVYVRELSNKSEITTNGVVQLSEFDAPRDSSKPRSSSSTRVPIPPLPLLPSTTSSPLPSFHVSFKVEETTARKKLKALIEQKNEDITQEQKDIWRKSNYKLVPPQFKKCLSKLLMDEKTHTILLHSKLEYYLDTIRQQLNDSKLLDDKSNPTDLPFPRSLEVYAPQSLTEYNKYMSMYYQREMAGVKEPPQLLPLLEERNLQE